MSVVDTTMLERSLQSLRHAVETYARYKDDSVLRVPLRSGVVGEYSLCWGRIRPVLQRAMVDLDAENPELIDSVEFGELMRMANIRGYTSFDWEFWRKFRDARNKAAHAYSEPIAEGILAIAPQFLLAAEEILAAVKRKDDNDGAKLLADE